MTDPIQQQLIAARKNQILDAAATLFAQKGFHPTTIRAIAQVAGISDGTIYNYFDNKTALLLAIFERMQAGIVGTQALPAAGESDPRTLIKAFLSHPLQALEKDEFALFRVVMSQMLVDAEMRDLYYTQIVAPMLALAERQFQQLVLQQGRQIVSPHLLVRIMSALVMGLMLERIVGDETLRETWEDLPATLAELILYGIEGPSPQ